MTALHFEALNGHHRNVKTLLNKGAEKNAEARYNYKRGYTPIILAAKEGHREIVDILIRYDANVEQETEDGYNAILWAAKEQKRDVLSRLVKYYQTKSGGIENLLMNSYTDIQKIHNCNQ